MVSLQCFLLRRIFSVLNGESRKKMLLTPANVPAGTTPMPCPAGSSPRWCMSRKNYRFVRDTRFGTDVGAAGLPQISIRKF